MERFKDLNIEELNTLMDVATNLKNKLEIEKKLFNIGKLNDKDLAFMEFICQLLNSEIRSKNKKLFAKIFGGLNHE